MKRIAIKQIIKETLSYYRHYNYANAEVTDDDVDTILALCNIY